MPIHPYHASPALVLLYPLWRCRKCDNQFLVRAQTAPPMCCDRRMAFWRPERVRVLET